MHAHDHFAICAYRGVGPAIVQVPPAEQLLPGLLGELAFLPLLAQLLSQAAQTPAVFPEELPLELLVIGARVDAEGEGCFCLHAAAAFFLLIVVGHIDSSFLFCYSQMVNSIYLGLTYITINSTGETITVA